MTTITTQLVGTFGRSQRPSGWAAAMVAIAAVLSLIVVVMLAIVLWLSVIDGQPGDANLAYTFAHYIEIFTDKFTYRVISNTIVFSAITLAFAMIFGVVIAYLIERTDFPAKSLVLTTMTIGILLPGFATAIGWQFLFHPRIGMVNAWAQALFGLSAAPFNIGTLWGMGWVQGLGLAPVAFVMTSVVFRSMDSALEEAAHMSGATVKQTLWRVTIPLVWPGVLAAGIYIFMIGFAAFDVPAIIGLAGNLFTFATYAYDQVRPAQNVPQYGPVAALSTVMVGIGLLLSWWYSRMQRRAPQYAVITGKAYRPKIVELGGYTWIAVAFVVFYLLVSQILPLLVLIWTSTVPFPQPPTSEAIAGASFANYGKIPVNMVWRGVINTAELMVLTPTITLIVAFSYSWVVLRSKIPGRSLFDFAAFLPHAVPNIVFSMAALLLALFILQKMVPIYGTIWILVLVYVISRISYATRITNSAMIQIHKELEEAASISGAGVGGIVQSVLAPLLKPALGYAFIWIALLTYRELTLPVLLSTNDNLPLAVVIWNMWISSQFAQASAVVVLMLVAMLPLLFLGFWVSRRRGVVVR